MGEDCKRCGYPVGVVGGKVWSRHETSVADAVAADRARIAAAIREIREEYFEGFDMRDMFARLLRVVEGEKMSLRCECDKIACDGSCRPVNRLATKVVVWFARGGGIERCGPFKSHVEAVKAMRLVARAGDTAPRYPNDMSVWPEEE